MHEDGRLYDAAVIGAGPAGSGLALLLARRGLRAALLDRAEAFPRAKLCGGFLSPDGAAALHQLNAGAEALPHTELSFSRVAPERGRAIILRWRPPAWGVSRLALDDFLFRAACAAGAEPHLGLRVKSLERSGGGWKLEAARAESSGHAVLHARVVAAADGHHSAFSSHPEAGGDFLAMQADFSMPWDEPHLFFAVTGAGYGGLLPLADGATHGCFLLHRRMESLPPRGEWPAMLAAAFPPLAEALRGIPDSAQWQVTANLSWGWRRPRHEGLFLLGDAACALPPIAGNGMAMALQGALLAAPFLEEAARNPSRAGDCAADSLRKLRRAFRTRTLATLALLRCARIHAARRALFATAAGRWPGLAEKCARWTRGSF